MRRDSELAVWRPAISSGKSFKPAVPLHADPNKAAWPLRTMDVDSDAMRASIDPIGVPWRVIGK